MGTARFVTLKFTDMKAIEDMTIQEMVAERKDVMEYLRLVPGHGAWAIDSSKIDETVRAAEERRDGLTRALDKKCLEAGISIIYGSFVYAKVFQGTVMRLESSEPFKMYRKIPAADQHALEGYLLSKNT